MKIGIFTNNYLPNPYGVTASAESFRKEFEALGHEVFVFAPKWDGYEDDNPNVFRYPSLDINLKFRFPLPIPFSRKIDKVIDGLDLDIIHSQHPNLLGSAARKWARRKKIPLVFTWHTLYDQYAHFAVIIPKKIASWWVIRNARIYANQADQVVVPSASVEKIIRKWGVVNQRVQIIPTGVERDFEDPDPGLIRKKYSLQKEDIVLFLVARLTTEKNAEFIFDSLGKMMQEKKYVKFVIVGEGYLEKDLRKKVRDLGISEQVIFCGIVPKQEIKNYFAAGDIFVFSSKSETQGMIINEAMYMGLPVVALDAPGVCDSVEDGKTGFLVPEDGKKFEEAVGRLIDDGELRQKFSQESKKIAQEKYTSKVCAEKMLILYKNVISTK